MTIDLRFHSSRSRHLGARSCPRLSVAVCHPLLPKTPSSPLATLHPGSQRCSSPFAKFGNSAMPPTPGPLAHPPAPKPR